MKRIITGLAVAAALIMGTEKAGAQFAVTDIPLLAQEVTAWIDEIASAGEQLSKLTDGVKKYQEMIDKTKAIYNKIDPFIQNGKAMYEVYKETERIAYDFKLIEEYITTFGQNGRITPSKVRSIRMLATRLATELEWIVKDIQEALKPQNNLTTKDREDAVEKRKIELKAVSETLEQTIHDDAVAMLNAEIEKSTQMATLASLGLVPTVEEEKKQEARFESLCREVEKKTGTSEVSDTDLYMADANPTVTKVFDFVSVVIGVMAVLMLVWAFGIRTKGELRHEDAMWKVFAGLIFILLLLQVLKVTIFGPNGFDMLIPKF